MYLFYDTALKELCEVGADLFSSVLYGYFSHIRLYHDSYKLFEGRLLRIPPEFFTRLRRVAPKIDNIGRTVEVRRYFNKNLACCLVNTFLISALSNEFKFNAYMLERIVAEFAYRVLLACGNHKVFGLLILQHELHALNIVLCISPVAQR